MNYLNILLGAALLMVGRRFFWLYVGSVGFAIGYEICRNLMVEKGPLIITGGALLVALALIVLAYSFQKVVIFMAGFLSGGYLGFNLIQAINLMQADYAWLLIMLGGLIGVALAHWLYDWAMIVFSSFLGGVLIAEAVKSQPPARSMVILSLAAIGTIIQVLQFVKKKDKK